MTPDFEEMRRQAGALGRRAAAPDDAAAAEAVLEAIAAAEAGNFGVGAVLLDPAGGIVARGRNRVFLPHFRSDLHAEMDLMTGFEERYASVSGLAGGLKGHTLVSSLEPCPMCTVRLIQAGVGIVLHAADDVPGGMVHSWAALPPAWREIGEGQRFERAACSAELRALAWAVFEGTAEAGYRRVQERRRR